MGRSIESYQRELHNLTPPGKAFTRNRLSNWSQLLRGLAVEFHRIDLAVRFVLLESIPSDSTIAGFLTDFETMVGVPNHCSPVLPATELERQQLVTSRFISRGGQSEQYFIDLALSLGFDTAEIFGGGQPFTCQSECDDPLIPGTEIFVWVMEVTGSADPEELRCILDRFKPAHTLAFVTLTGV